MNGFIEDWRVPEFLLKPFIAQLDDIRKAEHVIQASFRDVLRTNRTTAEEAIESRLLI